jgi:hypothetical protein
MNFINPIDSGPGARSIQPPGLIVPSRMSRSLSAASNEPRASPGQPCQGYPPDLTNSNWCRADEQPRLSETLDQRSPEVAASNSERLGNR